MKEVIKAIFDKVKLQVNSDLYQGVSSDFYYGQVPDPKNTTMPYIVFYKIPAELIRCFGKAQDMEQIVIQFSIYDDRKSIENIEDLFSDLDLIFDRANLIYDSKNDVGCYRMNVTGPTRLEDCWQMTADYMVRYT